MSGPTPADRPPVFHWAPSSRRPGILRLGLVPGRASTDGLWRPPYVCFADDPRTAWLLSGATARGGGHAEWDLWSADLADLPGHEEIYWDTGAPGSGPPAVKERRVYERVPKRHLWYAGSRARVPDGRRERR